MPKLQRTCSASTATRARVASVLQKAQRILAQWYDKAKQAHVNAHRIESVRPEPVEGCEVHGIRYLSFCSELKLSFARYGT
jgi:hypothetical protein